MVAALALSAIALFAPFQQQGPGQGEVRGVVRSEATGERLPYAVIEVVGTSRALVAMADSTGVYVIRNVPPGRHLLRVSRFDHAPLEVEVLVPASRPVSLDVLLEQRPVELPGIVASASPRGALTDTVSPAVPELSRAITRAIEATPGIVEMGLSSIGQNVPAPGPIDPSDILYVRGAPSDLRLVLLDGTPVYAPFHLSGLIQEFEPGLLRSADLHLGGAPARYDGGLSYVLGLETRAGRRTGVHGSGSADLLSTRVLVEGPLVTRGAGFLVGARAIHAGVPERLLDRSFPYDYGDLLARVDADVGEDGAVALTGFWNREAVRLESGDAPGERARWSNAMASLRYRGTVAGTDAEFTAAYSGYRAGIPLSGAESSRTEGRARRFRLAADLTRPGEATRIQYGITYERTLLDYRLQAGAAAGGDAVVLESAADGAVVGAYTDIGWRPAERWWIRAGGRLDLFSTEEVVRIAPRLAVTWVASDRASLTLAAGRYRQFVRSEFTLVDDSTLTVYAPPPLSLAHASHVVLGLDQELGEGVRLGIEGFYKIFDGLPSTDSAAGHWAEGASAARHAFAAAHASGLDLWLRRADGRLTGWLGYSLGWVWAADAPTGSDRFAGRQVLSVGLAGPVGDGRFDVRVAYGAGLPYSAVPGVPAPDMPDVLSRMETYDATRPLQQIAYEGAPLASSPDDPYLRLDIELSHPWAAEWGGRKTTFSPYVKVLNALGRRDAIFYRIGANSGEMEPLAELPIVPVIGFRWEF